jgi:hypothetical protein
VQIVLSYGMGIESTAILVRWLLEPMTRPCALEDLIVLTAMTGDEYADTGRDVTNFVLPLLREHSIRYVQVARAGAKEADGITVLSDTRQPELLYLEGDYRLSDELRSAGTVPQVAGVHRCSLKAKAAPLEFWLSTHANFSYRQAFGYNAEETKRSDKCQHFTTQRVAFGFNVDEQKRIDRAGAYDTPSRESFFPLQEWNWTRQHCEDYLMSVFRILWRRSACIYCPYNRLDAAALQRHRESFEQVADAMMLEHMSLSLNPRGQLYAKESLIQITLASGDQRAEDAYNAKLADAEWAVYRVRRIYQPGKRDGEVDYAKKGLASRGVENLGSFATREDAEGELDRLAASQSAEIEVIRNIRYAYITRRGSVYPTREEFFTAAPNYVQTKARYGIERFNEQWDAAQLRLFEACAA